MTFKKEVNTYAQSPEPKEVKGSALEKLIDSLTEEQKKLPIAQLPEDLKANYIKYTSLFILESMNFDVEAGFRKSIELICSQMNKNELSNFDYQINFKGTKDEIKEENFKLSFAKYDSNTVQNYEVSEIATKDEQEKEPRNKFEMFINESEKVIQVYDDCLKHFPNEKGSLMAAAGMLLIFEYISSRNAEILESSLSGFLNSTTEKEGTYNIIIHREEVPYVVEHLVSKNPRLI